MPFEDAAVEDQPQTEELTENTEQESSGESSATEDNAQLEGTHEADEADGADWLPDEQSKVFPEAEYQRYAEKRYPDLVALLKDEAISEPTRKAVQQILHDKINSDIELKRRSQEQEVTDEEEVEEEEDQPLAAQPIDEATWKAQVNNFVDQITDPKVANEWMGEFTKAFEIKDPTQRNIAATKILTAGVVNVMKDLLPAMLFERGGNPGVLDRYIESRYEGIGATVKQTTFANTWNDLIASDPALSNLPAYDSRPNSQWNQAIAKVAAMVPGFQQFTIPGASPLQNFIAKSKIAAQLIKNGGTQGAVANAKAAVEKGQQLEKEAARKKNLGKLGAGQSKGEIKSGSVSDPLKESLARLKSDGNPFAAMKKA